MTDLLVRMIQPQHDFYVTAVDDMSHNCNINDKKNVNEKRVNDAQNNILYAIEDISTDNCSLSICKTREEHDANNYKQTLTPESARTTKKSTSPPRSTRLRRSQSTPLTSPVGRRIIFPMLHNACSSSGTAPSSKSSQPISVASETKDHHCNNIGRSSSDPYFPILQMAANGSDCSDPSSVKNSPTQVSSTPSAESLTLTSLLETKAEPVPDSSNEGAKNNTRNSWSKTTLSTLAFSPTTNKLRFSKKESGKSMNSKIDLSTLVIPSFESIRLESENSQHEKRNLLFSTIDPRSLVIPPFRSNINAARVSISTTGNQSNGKSTQVSKKDRDLMPYQFPPRGGDYTSYKSHSETIKRNLRFSRSLDIPQFRSNVNAAPVSTSTSGLKNNGKPTNHVPSRGDYMSDKFQSAPILFPRNVVEKSSATFNGIKSSFSSFGTNSFDEVDNSSNLPLASSSSNGLYKPGPSILRSSRLGHEARSKMMDTVNGALSSSVSNEANIASRSRRTDFAKLPPLGKIKIQNQPITSSSQFSEVNDHRQAPDAIIDDITLSGSPINVHDADNLSNLPAGSCFNSISNIRRTCSDSDIESGIFINSEESEGSIGHQEKDEREKTRTQSANDVNDKISAPKSENRIGASPKDLSKAPSFNRCGKLKTRHSSHEEISHKCIRFDPRVWVYEFHRHRDEKIWYTPCELERFKYEAIIRIQQWKAAERNRDMIPSGTGRIVSMGGRRFVKNNASAMRALFTNPALSIVGEEDDCISALEHPTSHRVSSATSDEKLRKSLQTEFKAILLVEPRDIFQKLLAKGILSMIPHATITTASTAEEAQTKIFSKKRKSKQRLSCNQGFDIIVVEERLVNFQHQIAGINATAVNEKQVPLTSGSVFIQRLQLELEMMEQSFIPRPGHNSSVHADRKIMNDSEFRLPLIIGMSAHLEKDSLKLKASGADEIWGKPPPTMDCNLRNNLLYMIMKKRGHEIEKDLFG